MHPVTLATSGMSRLRVATSAGSASTTSRRNAGRRVVERLETVAGGAARLKVMLLLAGVLSLTSADMATVGATARQLESSLHIGNTDIGLLVTVSSGIAVFTTLPFGMLANYVPRVRLLVASIVTWSAMMVVCAAAPTFLLLLVFRVGLGAALAGAAPLFASLTGDLFEQSERGRIYCYVLGGELLGGGFGLLVCGDVAAASTWRASFGLLAVLGVLLAWVIKRGLPEPARGGRSRLQVGEADLARRSTPGRTSRTQREMPRPSHRRTRRRSVRRSADSRSRPTQNRHCARTRPVRACGGRSDMC